ncbi:MAG: lipid A export permease/ATP-binding protein MsbA [Thiotrichales bacterium]|nr:lipid A export permease/ATP-binding protein MsbA [Thiotrichales bacterium]OUX54236.1 MAG: lipid A export permease/ATP-binding protein MsbA [Methylococcaceae bacterium TMED282]
MLGLESKSWQTYKRLITHVVPHWKIFALSVVSMFLLASTEWVLPALLKPIIDSDFDLSAPDKLMLIPILLVCLFLFRGLLSYSATVALNWVAQRVIYDIRTKMFDVLIRLPVTYFDKRSSGVLISKFTFDVTQVADAATKVVTVLVKDFTVVIVLLAYLTFLNWRLAIMLLIFGPIIAIVIKSVSKRMRLMSHRLQESVGELNNSVSESIRGQREIKLFNSYYHEQGRFSHAANQARKFQMKVIRTSAMIVPVIQLIVASAVAVLIAIALREQAVSGMTKGDFVAFFTATALLLPPIKRLAGVNEFLQRGIAAAESVFILLDTPIEIDTSAKTIRFDGAIEFSNVYLTYDDKEVLFDISMSVRPGETWAIVGRSGAGKTSIVNLLPRFYSPTKGTIHVDGKDLSSYSLECVRHNMSYVSQNIVLFNDTIYNNIAYGSHTAFSPDQIVTAAERAQVSVFSDLLPDGLDTIVGDNGVRLSGGQRQRIAIARAFLKDAPILIMDEATAALDNKSERLVQTALKSLKSGRTTFVVAHRLSTIVEADQIMVVDNGRVSGIGTHDEMLADNTLYSQLYSAGFN